MSSSRRRGGADVEGVHRVRADLDEVVDGAALPAMRWGETVIIFGAMNIELDQVVESDVAWC